MANDKKIIVGGIAVIIFLAALLSVMGGPKKSKIRNGNLMSPETGMGYSQDSFLSDVPSAMSEGRGMAQKRMETAPAPFMAGDNIAITDKKVIKNGSLNLKVTDTDSASSKISQIAKDNGGDVFSSNFYETEKNMKSGSISVKVPVNNFEKTFSELKKVATLVVQESISGQDVTEQYADLQAQIKNKQAEEQQFQSILTQAQKIQDILDVTRELARVRGEIEMLQGQIKYLDSQTDMSLITIYLTEDTNITFSDSWRPWQVVKETFNSLFKDIQKFINFIIVLIIRVIPIAILYALIAMVIYFIGKKIYSKFKKPE
ncbi:MAG TPA: hypothetical protein DIT25_00600 [Candidatus Moranbacteria bacterium]|nr:hypothetical protein [Candidatus Moranbacteria bacterium]